MNTLSKIIEFLTYTAIIFAAVEVYLKINKIWKRKHDKEVAESQSILGLGIAAFVLVIWSLNFIIKGDFEAIADNMIYLFETFLLIIIGSGIFVSEKKRSKKSFWEMIKDSVRMERKEADYLLKTIAGKQTAEKIMKILQMMAWIDDDFDKKEKELIVDFAAGIGLKTSDKHFENPHSPNELRSDRFKRIIKALEDYLSENPKKEEINGLRELLLNLIKADGKITTEEDVMMGELNSVILEIGLKQDVPKYLVIVIPQEESHRKLIESILKQMFPDKDPAEN